jgi:cob(I)alamin adenosyltransferase
MLKKDQRTLSLREKLKGFRLEYLYEASPDIARYPLLGSAVRALGKEWSVKVLPSDISQRTFEGLQRRLKDPSRLNIGSEDTNNKNNLVLVESPDTHKAKAMRDAFIESSHIMIAGNDSGKEDYDLISIFSSEQLKSKGVIAITGTGKGKSTTAFGIAAEAVANGKKTAIVQWFKEPKGERGTWSINEHYFPDMLKNPTLLEFYPTGSGFYGSPKWDRVKTEEAYQQHKEKAEDGVALAKKIIRSGEYDVLVLDEFVDTLYEVSQNIPRSLLTVESLQNLLSTSQQAPNIKIVVTGRRVTPEWKDFIKKSYVITEVKHPWSSKGKAAISGLDF